MKSSTLQALHSSASPEHGTPPEIVEAARRVLGGIDLDPSSSSVFNAVVKAGRYYTKEGDGLTLPWFGHVFLNPPSGDGGKLVKAFWLQLVGDYLKGYIDSAIYIGFSIDQLQTLQNTRHGGPLQFPLCIPRKRLKFSSMIEQPSQVGLFGEPEFDLIATTGESPTKPNFICYLPHREDSGLVFTSTCDRFAEEFEKFGEVRI